MVDAHFLIILLNISDSIETCTATHSGAHLPLGCVVCNIRGTANSR